MSFHVGQPIVCVRACPDGCGLGTEALPKVGTVYTVREADVCRYSGVVCVLLVEIVNPVALYWLSHLGVHVHCEPAFNGNQFRPLDEKRLDVFRAMLVTPPKETVSA